jgi:hypothetical protein
VKEVDKGLKSLPWVDKDSVKVSYDEQNARFRVADMSEFSEKELRRALGARKVVIQNAQKL